MLFIRCLNFVDFLFVREYEGMVCNNGEAAVGGAASRYYFE